MPSWQRILKWTWNGVVLSLTLAFILYVAIHGLIDDRAANRCAILYSIVIVGWAQGWIPTYVTAMSVPLLAVALRVLKGDNGEVLPADAAATIITNSMLSSVVLVQLGGMVLGAALTKYRLIQDLGLNRILRLSNSAPLVLLAATALSVLLSLLLPLEGRAAVLASLTESLLMGHGNESRFPVALCLTLLMTSIIGSMSLPISSVPSVFAFSEAADLLGHGALPWLLATLPVVVLSSLATWAIICTLYGQWGQSVAAAPSPAATPLLQADGQTKLKRLYQSIVGLTFLTTMGLWVASPYLRNQIGGVGIISLVPIVVFFGTGVLNAADLAALPWEPVLLLMGGLGLVKAINLSDLIDWFGKETKMILAWGPQPAQAALLLCSIGLSSLLKSRLVTALIFLPIVKAALSHRPDGPVLYLLSAMACSVGMNVGFHGNTIKVLEERYDDEGKPFLGTGDLIKTGILVTLITGALVMSVGYPILRVVY